MSRCDSNSPDGRHCNYHTVTFAGLPFLYRQRANASGALICLSPKSGSSMWLQALHRGASPSGWNRPMTSRHGQPQPWPSWFAMYRAALARAETPRYALVRHPHVRLLSAWLGKVRSPKSAPRLGLMPIGFAYTNRSFEALVEHVGRYPESVTRRAHFALQTSMCAGTPPGAAPWRVLRIEEIETWYEELVCALGIAHAVQTGWSKYQVKGVAPRLPCMVPLGCGCRVDCGRRCAPHERGRGNHGTFNNADHLMSTYYTPRLARMVTTFARPDLDAFGYAPWAWGTSPRSTLRALHATTLYT